MDLDPTTLDPRDQKWAAQFTGVVSGRGSAMRAVHGLEDREGVG